MIKEIRLGTNKRLLCQKHPSANVLEVDIQTLSSKGEWRTRISLSLSTDVIKQLAKEVEQS
jgi:hypothetical protein